ncbi:hypothetical protein ACFXJ6_34345 [Streptomyces sp. NPDC059218]|uniref:hypothetical protein n=1 Tax=unclassified Streptomyces TaxID=2593676 RepID=UPI0036BF955C
MPTRTFAVAAAVVGTAVLATGITYAATDGSTQSEPTAGRVEQPVHRAAHPARPATPARQAAPAPAPLGSESGSGDKGDERGEGDRGGDHESSDRGGRGDEGGGRGGRGDEGGGRGGRDRSYDRKEERIHFNERSYSALSEGCITAASGLGSSSFSIYNDSRKVVEVYRGFSCDGGAPVATVGPYGSTYGVATRTVHDGPFFDNGVVGSFRVIGHDDEW